MRRRSSGFLLVALSAALGWGTPGAAAGESPAELRVAGAGTASAAPDRVEIDFSVWTEAKRAEDAARANAEKSRAVVAALRDRLGATGSVETRGYRLQPRFNQDPGSRSRTIVGYTANNTVQVRTAELEAAGALIDRAIESGANQVAQLQFTIADPTPLESEALAEAARAARSKAESVADALGLKIVRVLHVEQDGLPRPEPMTTRALRAEAMATPVEPADVEVHARVVLTVEVAEKGP